MHFLTLLTTHQCLKNILRNTQIKANNEPFLCLVLQDCIKLQFTKSIKSEIRNRNPKYLKQTEAILKVVRRCYSYCSSLYIRSNIVGFHRDLKLLSSNECPLARKTQLRELFSPHSLKRETLNSTLHWQSIGKALEYKAVRTSEKSTSWSSF